MNFFIICLFLAIGIFLVIQAFNFSFKHKKKKNAKKSSNKASNSTKTKQEYKDGVKPGCCPICGTPLVKPERVQSVVFEGGNEREGRLCHINGCIHCLKPDSNKTRLCPVCQKQIPKTGHLVAMMFLRNDKSHHVHILGCTECHKKK